jgi:hypothetical protein
MMSDTGFAGDPYHEGGSQPMDGLKGGMEQPNTQMPMQGENSGDTDGNTVTPQVAGWHTTSLAHQPAPTGGNDGARAH